MFFVNLYKSLIPRGTLAVVSLPTSFSPPPSPPSPSSFFAFFFAFIVFANVGVFCAAGVDVREAFLDKISAMELEVKKKAEAQLREKHKNNKFFKLPRHMREDEPQTVPSARQLWQDEDDLSLQNIDDIEDVMKEDYEQTGYVRT